MFQKDQLNNNSLTLRGLKFFQKICKKVFTNRFNCDIIRVSKNANNSKVLEVEILGTIVTNIENKNRENANGTASIFIDPTALGRQLAPGMIQPAKQEVLVESVEEHKAEPLKDVNDIKRMADYYLSREQYRNYMMFIVGINFGLRRSDLLRLRFCDLIDQNMCFKTTFPILEKKTSNTRKVKRNRYITINNAVVEAVTLYLQHNRAHLDDYMFRSESNNKGKGNTGSARDENKPMSRTTVDNVLKEAARELGIQAKVSSHSLRKTFGYHQMVMSGNDPRKLLLLQKIFGHSTAAQTLDYIGITGEEIEEAYLSLNLGGSNCYSDCVEDTQLICA